MYKFYVFVDDGYRGSYEVKGDAEDVVAEIMRSEGHVPCNFLIIEGRELYVGEKEVIKAVKLGYEAPKEDAPKEEAPKDDPKTKDGLIDELDRMKKRESEIRACIDSIG